MTKKIEADRPAGLRLEALQTGYRAGRATKVVSHSLTAEVAQGSLTMLLGANGSGKSTLLQTISGLLSSLSGEIYIAGKPLSGLRMPERARLLSLVLTDRIVSDVMTVRELVRIGRYPHVGYLGRLSVEDERIVSEAIVSCHLEGMEGRTLSALSDGERQRVMIARALAQETPLILLDEPTAHLDLPTRVEIILMLRDLARERERTILLSTHELELALSWADTIWLMDRRGEMHCDTGEAIVNKGLLEHAFGNERLTYDTEARTFVPRRPQR